MGMLPWLERCKASGAAPWARAVLGMAKPAWTVSAAGRWLPAGSRNRQLLAGRRADTIAASLLLDAAPHGDTLRGNAADQGVHVGALLGLPGQLGVLRVVVYLQGGRDSGGRGQQTAHTKAERRGQRDGKRRGRNVIG